MNILEYGEQYGIQKGLEQGLSQGREQGLEQGICSLIQSFNDVGLDKDRTVSQLMEKYSLTREQAEEKIQLYWK